jgi:dihydropteroate synthase
MLKPWALGGSDRPHHALPLGGGCWRAPAPEDAATAELLGRWGWRHLGELPDGAGRWQALAGPSAEAPPHLDAVTADELDPEADRAAWIHARLAAGRAAMAAPLTAPRLMAILNLSPDSFSDGADTAAFGEGTGALLDKARCLQAEGADRLDLGAESTRPGALPVPTEEQLARLLPAIEALAPIDLPLSVDTRDAEVARRCLEAGADMVNDVSGLADPGMAPLLAATGTPAVLMHLRGTPEDMQERTGYRHLLGEVADELMSSVARARAAGVDPARLILDPGIGFAKDAVQSRELVARGGALRALGLPLLFGPSRKSFMADTLPGRRPDQRDAGTAGAAALCAAQGASWLRLHRGGRSWDAVKVAAAAARAAHEAADRDLSAPPVPRSEQPA